MCIETFERVKDSNRAYLSQAVLATVIKIDLTEALPTFFALSAKG